MKKIHINKDGCPCSNDCCNDPDLFCPEHDCPDRMGKDDPNEDFCESCYILECRNCGSSCQHEL